MESFSQDPIGFNGRDENLYGYVGNSPTNATDPSGLIDPENHGSTEYPEVYHPKTVMLPPWWAHECCQCDDNLPASQGQQRLSIGALDTPPMTAERSKQYAIAEMEYQIRQAQQYGRSTALMQADLMKMQIRPAAPAPLLVTLGPQDAGYGLYWDVLAIAGAVAKGPNPTKTAAGAHYPYRVGAPSNNPVATAPLNPGASREAFSNTLAARDRVISLMESKYSGKKLGRFTTVVAGVDEATGKIIVKAKSTSRYGNTLCAEDLVSQAFGGNRPLIKFTPAIRPRTGEVIPVCERCQGKYPESQFPYKY